MTVTVNTQPASCNGQLVPWNQTPAYTNTYNACIDTTTGAIRLFVNQAPNPACGTNDQNETDIFVGAGAPGAAGADLAKCVVKLYSVSTNQRGKLQWIELCKPHGKHRPGTGLQSLGLDASRPGRHPGNARWDRRPGVLKGR